MRPASLSSPSSSESAEKPGDTIEYQPPQKSHIETVEKTGNSNLEAGHMNTQKEVVDVSKDPEQ